MEILTVNNGEGTYEISIPLVSRIIYLRGDSGVGKTTLAELITAYNTDDPDIYVKIPEGFSIEVITSVNNVRSDINNRVNAILIIDDNLGSESVSFSKDLENILRSNNNYLIIINRVDIIVNSLNSGFVSSLEYSTDSVLWVRKEEGNPKRIVSKFVDMFPTAENLSSIVTILCEDTYGMREFCESHNKNRTLIVKSSLSKDKVVPMLLNMLSGDVHKDIILYVDLIRFGQYLGDLYSIIKHTASSIIIDVNFLSYEYFILNTNLFDKGDLVKGLKENVDTTEKTYELKLEEICLNRLGYKYHHGSKNPICLLDNCYVCQRYPSHCSNVVEGEKLSYMLNNTCYEYLKNLLKEK